jgi:REP element-mobilizing transposase RayT
LAGIDPLTGHDFEHRREWIRRRLEMLASVFGIDVLTYAILSNHLHVVLRNRPDVVNTWNDREVALRWLRVFPGTRIEDHLAEPTEANLKALIADKEKLTLIRQRMSDVSWFMRSLAEPIARMANRADGCTGRFWEGRFKAQRLTDESALLACAMYVDLNPIRAAMAESIEQSVHTSAFDRVRAEKGETVESVARDVVPVSIEDASRERRESTPQQRRLKARQLKQPARSGRRIARDAWLAPLMIGGEAKGKGSRPGAMPSRSGVRASDKGFLSIPLRDYLKLLDWTGRQGRKDKRGKIPSWVAPILSGLGIDGKMWCDLVWNYRRYFGGRCAGSPESMKAEAERCGRNWSRGQRSVAVCFSAR